MKLLEKLSEGVIQRDVRKEQSLLVEKWSQTGLLDGLERQDRTNMAILLENQTKELIREASTMAAGDVAGFASVAFPMVRRIHGKAIATKIVSVQPMSMPAGLIFFLDFVYNTTRQGNPADASVYGGNVVGSELTSGVKVEDTGNLRYGERGFYNLNNSYSSATGTFPQFAVSEKQTVFMVENSETTDKLIQYDPDLESGSYATVLQVTLTAAEKALMMGDNLMSVVFISSSVPSTMSGSTQVRRLTHWDEDDADRLTLNLVFHSGSGAFTALSSTDYPALMSLGYASKDNLETPNLGAIVGTSAWELENNEEIPEINIKVDSIAVTAGTKKLKAVWTPELAQDLTAFHNVDSEVELTGILSDQIELEINAELLTDLCKGATAGKFYWSRRPGKFLNRTTGADITSATSPPDFTGNVSEWYETLLETINDLSAKIYRKVLKGGANFMVVNPDVASILEMTNGFRANSAVDDEMGDAGTQKIGTISRKWEIYVDPHFYRNVILVGRKGKSFLESGYVYSPYVPLQVSPTILHVESFVPRKAIMTRYAKQMVRPDYYGLVFIENMTG